jgi:hypothetical protein
MKEENFMANEEQKIHALGAQAAYNLANVTKTRPQYGALTPKWLTKFLEFKGLETGIYRVNRVVEGNTPLDVLCSQTKKSDIIPQGFIDYETEPREYRLNSISTIVNVNTAIEDVYSLRERQESQLINNDDYGLLKNVPDSQRIQSRTGSPTPDDLDELISKVWKEPSFFLAHPRAIAAFERECTRRGVPPVTANINGGTFILWRGIPLIPTDKLLVDGLKNPQSQSGKTNILLVRTGEAKRGVIGLFQAGMKNEQSRGLSVRYRGIDDKGVASYLLSLYCSAAILADDAIAVLEDVEVGNYYEYDI